MNVEALVTLSVHWLLAAIFAQAFDHKITDFTRFAAVFGAWRVVPRQSTQTVGYGVAIAEFITVITNLMALRIGLLFAAMLLLVYAVGMQVNRRRGRSFIDCGCGDEPVPLTAGLLVRNGALVLLACLAMQLVTTGHAFAALSWIELLQSLAAAMGAFGIYRCAELLMANAARFRQSGYSAA